MLYWVALLVNFSCCRLDNSPDVTRFLAPVPGDYSYFTKPLSSAPAGPEFWRLRLANRGMFCLVAFAVCGHKIAPSATLSGVHH